MSKHWIVGMVILLTGSASIVETHTCDVDMFQRCVYTVTCVMYAGSAQNPTCDYEPHVTFKMIRSLSSELNAGFFGATNFDSRVRIIIAVNNSWTSIAPAAFRYYTKTLEMNLSGNNIKEIQNESFKNVDMLKYLNLSSNYIETLYAYSLLTSTQSSDNHIEILDLSNNYLKHIAYNSFGQCTSLQELHLQNNKITNLGDDVFSNLKSLTYLNLQNNKLTTLNMTLIYLKSLIGLDLSHNAMEKVSGYELNRLTSLERLNMSFNNIEYIESNCFNQAFHLETLDVSNNKIKTIVNLMFINNDKLTYLNLYNNNITQIQDNAFQHNMLVYFSLGKNFISGEITEATFAGLQRIQRLNLFNQNITSLKANAFNEMTNLTELNLSTNNIDRIDQTSFKNASLLSVLDLSYNNLKNLDFLNDSLTNLTELFLSNNKIQLIPTNTFVKQTLMTKLDISMNRIIAVEQYSLPLRYLQYFNITGNPTLGVVKSNTFSPAKYLRYLDLSNLNISRIDDMAFIDLPVLSRLNLSNNVIEYIGPNNFINLDNMFSLDLSKNRLTTLQLNGTTKSLNAFYINHNALTNVTGALPNSTQIMYLDVSYNNISEIKGPVFETMKNLRVLHASHNKIKIFNNYQMNLMSKLNDLGLSSNQISLIDISFFKNLISLDISNNTLNYINSTLFQNLDNLQALDISNNNITALPPGVFQNVKILKLLNMSSNNLHDLRYGSLRGLHKTEVIDISRNSIVEMDVDVFHECAELTRLIIDYNHIQHLDIEQLIKVVPKLTSLSIGGNSLACKQIVRNVKYINTTAVRFIEITSINKIYHEDNVNGIQCGDVDSTTSTVSPTNTLKQHAEVNTTSWALLIWCLILTTIFALLVAVFFYYKRNYTSIAKFSQARLQLGRSVELSGSDFQRDLLN